MLRFSAPLVGECNNNVYLQGNLITLANSEKHVGNLIGNSPTLQAQIVQTACNQLYGKLNFLMRQIGACKSSILYVLFKNYCMSLYGCQLWNYSSLKSINPVYIAWRKCVRRIFKLPSQTHNSLLYYICKDGPIDTQLHRRFLKFILSITNSSNSNVKFLSKHVIKGSLSSTCDSLSYVSYLYNLDRYNITVSCVSQLQIPVNQAVECKAGLIADFIEYRDSHLNDNAIKDIINTLSVK